MSAAEDRTASVIVLGSGFVGSVIARQLAETVTVSAMSRGTHPELGSLGPSATDALRREIDRTGAGAVVNCVGLLRGSVDEMTDANVAWPTWLAHDALAGTGVRLVHLGSAAEYGDQGSADPIPETAEPRPVGLYGETKWAGSAAVLKARSQGLDAVVGRGFNLVGPHLSPVSPLHQFIADIDALGPDGGEVEVWWPDTVRDFVLLDDLARAVARLALVAEPPDVVNLCSSTAVTFAEIVHAIAAERGVAVTIRSLDRPGIPAVVGDNARLRHTCGFVPQMSAEIIARSARIGALS